MALKSGLAQYRKIAEGKIDNSFDTDQIRNLQGKMFSARVVSINQRGQGDNGTIQCTILDEVKLNGSNIVSNVKPLFPNLKNYPLVNEVVVIIPLADQNYQQNYNKPIWYYINPINLWNSQQTNPLPPPQDNYLPDTNKKSYQQIEATSNPNKPSAGNNTEFKVGTYFVERGDVNPLYPYEGDVILDGRFGNSIRLGNTVPNGLSTITNNWSRVGKVGDPITIISNGHRKLKPSYSSITEDINNDNSSIYLTSTQAVQFQVSSINDYLSYDNEYGGDSPTYPDLYKNPQIIINSGRLLLNSTSDHILLSSQKSVNLNAVESINLDTTGPIVLESSIVLLGSSTADESVLLGDSTVDILQGLLSDLKLLFNVVADQLGNNGILLEPAGTLYRNLVNNIDVYSSQLDSIKSTTVKVE